jgi:NDP-sugar pyrophosphorylase family protein
MTGPASGILRDVREHKKTRIADCDVFVLAGGLGTRIRGVLGATPKILAPIHGRPYLDLLIEWLARYGVRRIVLGLGHGAQAVASHLEGAVKRDLVVDVSVESAPLGTAGAIRLARPKLRSDPVLVMNGDGIVECNLDDLAAFHSRSGCAATMVVSRVEDAKRYGQVRVRDERIDAFIEKDPQATGAALVNAGVYLFSREALDRIAEGDAVSLENDVFARMPPGSIAAFVSDGRFLDIGTPDSLREANSPQEGRFR